MSRTILGKVISRQADYFTIVLERGNTVKINLTIDLKIGSICNVYINPSNGTIINVSKIKEEEETRVFSEPEK